MGRMKEGSVSPGGSGPSLIKCRRLPATYAAIGLAFEFIIDTEQFGAMPARTLFLAVRTQLKRGYHVAAFRDQKLVGYCGWLNTTEEIAENWLKGEGTLDGVPIAQSNAVALTIVRVTDRSAVPPIIRSCRQLNASRRVYFKREQSAARAARKASVFNV
jgi:hypothetical protein